MASIAYCNPFVPPEWIAAHGLKPHWLQPRSVGSTLSAQRGICPAAAAVVDTLLQVPPGAAVVLTTTCDQIRYAAALLEHQGKLPVFLMHVPRTWQAPSARAFYREELHRLSRFLVQHGGTEPTADHLRDTMSRYDRARADLRSRQPILSAVEFAHAATEVREDLQEDEPAYNSRRLTAAESVGNSPKRNPRNLALLGGPMPADGGELFRIIENAGGRIVLDATESGERTLPPPFNAGRLRADPLEELVRAYFDEIPDVFHRPNDRLYTWLRQQIVERKITGLLVRRYVWCDLWHAELPRLTQELALPVLDWDVADDDPGDNARTIGRLEAFLET
jgi:benzoyl-CoA reductase/2-hydroxyglutaryl-CoA dehydratase subunit BcrC/BadD/HgdB